MRKRRGKEMEMRLQISKSYGDKQVFQGLDLEIREGEILCIFGE